MIISAKSGTNHRMDVDYMIVVLKIDFSAYDVTGLCFIVPDATDIYDELKKKTSGQV